MLNGEQAELLSRALLSAFPQRSALDQLVRYELDENLSAISSQGDLRSVIFELVRWAEAHDQLEKLLEAARKRNPRNPDLIAFLASATREAAHPVLPAHADAPGARAPTSKGPPLSSSIDWRNPGAVLVAAINAVPGVKYALGVAGVAAIVSIVTHGFGLDGGTAVFGTLIVMVLMLVLLVLAVAARQQQMLRAPAIVLTWSFLLITIGSSTLLVATFFFHFPQSPRCLFYDECTPPTVSSPPSAISSTLNEPSPEVYATAPIASVATPKTDCALPPFAEGGADFRILTSRANNDATAKKAAQFRSLLRQSHADDWVFHVSDPVAGALEGNVQLILLIGVRPVLLGAFCTWIQCVGWDTGSLGCEERKTQRGGNAQASPTAATTPLGGATATVGSATSTAAPAPACLSREGIDNCMRACETAFTEEIKKCSALSKDPCAQVAENRKRDVCVPRCEASSCR